MAPLRAPASSFSLGCRCASSPCVTFTAPGVWDDVDLQPARQGDQERAPLLAAEDQHGRGRDRRGDCGVGVTNVLFYQIARAVAAGKLKLVRQDYEPDPIPVHLVHPG